MGWLGPLAAQVLLEGGGAQTSSDSFTYLWAGESGLGKSTLVHSLFLTDLYKDRKLLSAEGE